MLNDKQEFRVRYSVTTTLEGHGEFSGEQKVTVFTMNSVSDDLGEIFTDLHDQHRGQPVIGMEILAVEKVNAYEPVYILSAF